MPKLATKVVSWLDVQKDDVILDLGCGGEFSSFSYLMEGGFNPSFHYANLFPCWLRFSIQIQDSGFLPFLF